MEVVTVGVWEWNGQQSWVHFYPNPVQPGELLNLKTTVSSGIVAWQAFDVLGRSVDGQQNLNHIQELTLDVSGWSAGMHIVQVTTGDGEWVSGKIDIRGF